MSPRKLTHIGTSRVVKLAQPGANPDIDADRRIRQNIRALLRSKHGENILAELQRLLEGTQHGLTLSQCSLLVALVREAYVGGRKDNVEQRIKEALGN